MNVLWINQEVTLPLTKSEIDKQVEAAEIMGRVCYKSEPKGDPIAFLSRIINRGHESVIEHINIPAVLSTDRAVTHQLVRHRHGSFCLAGDTKVRTYRGWRTLEQLYKLEPGPRTHLKARCMDEDTKELFLNQVKDIFYSGKQDVYRVKTAMGYEIKATLKHRFLTLGGWKRLEDIVSGDKVYVNGIPAYKSKDWLKKHYHELNESHREMANLCGCSHHTIRTWVRKLGLAKPLGSWSIGVAPPNKGRTKEDYEPMRRTSQKMLGHHHTIPKYMEENQNWKGDDITNAGGYNRTRKANLKTGVCSNCGAQGPTHLHHLDKNPKNYSSENVIELCPNCHHGYHHRNLKVAIPDRILSIEYVGQEDTYDLAMATEPHNFVANGFIVHNSQESQRYVNYDRKGIICFVRPQFFSDEKVDPKTIEEFKNTCQNLAEKYVELVQGGLPPEEARGLLPNCTATVIGVTANLREWRHIFRMRLDGAAQPQIRALLLALRQKMEMKYDLAWAFKDIPVNANRLHSVPEL